MNSTKPGHYIQLLDMQMWITISLVSCCRHGDIDVEPERGLNFHLCFRSENDISNLQPV